MFSACLFPVLPSDVFAIVQSTFSHSDVHNLSPCQRQDLADVLLYLACGEASAVHAFTGRLLHKVPWAAQATLTSIAEDEMRHAHLIETIQKNLPPARQTSGLARLAMFFRRLESSDPAEHLAHVAALDRAVCQVLHPLLSRGAAISRSPSLHRALSGLRQDEARHVCMARNMARQLGITQARQAHLNQNVRERLQSLLRPVHPALERLALPTDAHQDREYV